MSAIQVARDLSQLAIADPAAERARLGVLLPAFSGSKSGYWYAAPVGTLTTALIANGVLSLSPLVFGKAVTVDQVALEVTTAGAAGSVVRVGIYADTGDGFPGALLSDCGTVDSTTTGVKTIVLGATLALAAGIYWVGAVPQGAPATNPTLRINQGLMPLVGNTTTSAITTNPTAWTVASITGALPGTWTGTLATTNSIRVAVRLA